MTTHFAAVCVGTAFPPEYVERLYQGIRTHFSGEWDFTVICDAGNLAALLDSKIGSPSGEGRTFLAITHLSLPPSWWHKLNLFRDDIWPKGETVFYMDLDTVIVGSLDRLAERKGFNMLNWGRKYYPYGSGVMVFPAGIAPALFEVWSKLSYEVLQRSFPKGDQQLIAEYFRACGGINGIKSDEVASYKKDGWHGWHGWHGGPKTADPVTRDASIIAFHGRPRPHELVEGQWGFAEWRGHKPIETTEK